METGVSGGRHEGTTLANFETADFSGSGVRAFCIQQGVFLCIGAVTAPFEANLKAISECDSSDSVINMYCEMKTEERLRALKELNKMNIHRESLFPGLDGFAQSLVHRLRMYLELHT